MATPSVCGDAEPPAYLEWSVYDTMPGDDAAAAGAGGELRAQFRKVRTIRRGAQGAVYEGAPVPTGAATDGAPLPPRVAIKRLFKQLPDGGAFGAIDDGVDSVAAPPRSREAELLPTIRHPNVVRCFGAVGAPHGETCLVTELCVADFEELAVGRRASHMSLPHAKFALRAALTALEHLAARGVVHRDVKPSNLLIAADGNVKLGDFGSARTVATAGPAAEGGGTLTPAARCVTLLYRSPELLLGARGYGGEVDVWALGVTFAELLQKRHLFACRSEVAMLGKVFGLIGTPTDATWPGMAALPMAAMLQFAPQAATLRDRFAPLLSPQGFDLLERMLAADPSKRITAAAALAHPFWEEAPHPCGAAEMLALVAASKATAHLSPPKFSVGLALGDGDDEEDDEDDIADW